MLNFVGSCWVNFMGCYYGNWSKRATRKSDTIVARVCVVITIMWVTVLLTPVSDCKISVLNDSWYIAWVYMVGNYRKYCERFSFPKFCDQRKLLLLYKIQKKQQWHIFSNAISGLPCHSLIQSWFDSSVMVSTILQMNIIRNIRMWNCISNNDIYSKILGCLCNVMFMFI